MAVKIKDVAERAGVAKSTVSNALTGNKYVSEELKQKILKICEEMNYHPSFYASKMAGDQSNIIALFLEESESGQYHSFYTELIESCLKHISASGYNLFISYNADGRERQGLLQKGKTLLDGAIIISPASHDDERIALLEDELIPCVSIGKPADSQMVSYVDVDNARLVRNAVHLLALSGYTKIYLLNSSEKLNISCDRTASFLKALTDEKLEGDGSSICYCTESSEEEGAAFAKKVMAEDVAFITANTWLAQGVYACAAEMELGIGEDVGVFALGGKVDPEKTPRLAYATQDYGKLARLAADILLQNLEEIGKGEFSERKIISLPCKISFDASINRK